MTKHMLVLVFSVLLMNAGYSQEKASVSGFVKDKGSGETLISANVGFLNTTRGTTSNTSGYFTITNIEPGEYTLVCSYIGFTSFQRKITLKPGEKLRLDIELEPTSAQLDEIVVESQQEEREERNIGVAQVNAELIKKLPAVFEADVFRSIQLLPGVKASSDFSSGLFIRGGSPDQTLILLDRTTVYNPSHFFGFFSTFNPDAIKDVRLYKGGYPAEYGGRLGSVLTIYNKDGNRVKQAGGFTLGMLASRANIEGPFKKGSYALAIRRSTLEPLLAAIRQNNDNVPQSFYFVDVNGKINFDASPNNKFSLALYTGVDNVRVPFADDAEFSLNYGNQTLSGTWTHIFSDKAFSNFTFTGSRYFNFPELNLATTPIERENNIYDFSFKGDIEYLPSEKHSFATGIWGGNLTLRLNDSFDGNESFTSRIQSQYGSFYVQDTWRPSEKWEIIGGTRLNYFSEGSFLRVEPRLSVEYKPGERIRWQAAYGRYNQFLTLITNEAFSGFDVWLTTDEGVAPAFGDQFILGAKTRPFKGYGFDVEVYYRTMEDLFELDPFIADAAGLDYADLFRFGNGFAYGAEFFLEKRTGRLSGFIGYTLGFTWRKFPNFNIDLSDPLRESRFFPPKYDRRHDINIVGTYQLSRKWKMTSTFNYATGQAYTEPLGRFQAFDSPFIETTIDALTVGRVNASRLPAYHRLDMAFSRATTFFGRGKAEWQIQIINVYSRRNIWFFNYDFDDNPVSRDEVPLLPILPTVSYSVSF